MQTILGPELSADPALKAAVDRATPILESVLGPSAGPVRAEWRLEHDNRDRPVILLNLSEESVTVTGFFAPDEFSWSGPLTSRFCRLWNDLLRERSQLHLDKLRSLLDELEGARVAQD